MEDDINESGIRDNFIKKSIPDRKYHIHSDINLWINLTITEILNYDKLFDNKLSMIKDNKKDDKNYNYLEIEEKVKQEKLEEIKKYIEGNEKSNKYNSILGYEIPNCELYFIVKLFVDEIERKPSYQTKIVFNTKNINQYIPFKFKYKDLTEESYILIEIYTVELENSFLGKAKIFLFDKYLNLSQGRHSIKINNNLDDINKNEKELYTENEKEIDLLINSFYGKEYENSENYYGERNEGINIKDSKIKIEEIKDNYFYNLEAQKPQIKTDLINNYESKLKSLLDKTNNSFIIIKFPSFKYQVIYEEEILNNYINSYKYKNKGKDNIWIKDASIYKGNNFLEKDNPVSRRIEFFYENCNIDLAKEIRLNPLDKEIIDKLLNTPDFIDLGKEKEIFWKYRYELQRNNTDDAITKILNSVNWNKKEIYKEFINNILKNWKNIEMCDILYILSRKFSVNKLFMDNTGIKDFEGLKVLRQFAVKRLNKFPIDEINFILLQLVQAIKYEDISLEKITSPLVNFLIEKSKTDIVFATFFYWFIVCESITEENKETEINNIFCKIKEYFLEKMKDKQQYLNIIKSEIEFKNEMEEIGKIVKNAGSLQYQKNKLSELIDIDKKNFMHNEEHYLPIEPKIKVKGIFSGDCTVFSSSTRPIKITFKMTPETKIYNRYGDKLYYKIIYKSRDDLRQDQLILQMINFMDSLLKKRAIDCGFSTYKVLATSKFDGFLEFVPDSETYFDIKQEKFINSLAGYCAVNYILGVADRHDHNVMFNKKDGRIFHIDFGYVFGKEPHLPYFIPFKISRDMVDCMGGNDSENYKKFSKKCVNAYLILREHARTIVNMFYLMIDSGIPQLKDIQCLKQLYDRFCPNLTKEQAKEKFLKELEESLNSVYAEIREKFHKLKQDFL